MIISLYKKIHRSISSFRYYGGDKNVTGAISNYTFSMIISTIRYIID